ncbi:lactonase family protein [uncultured Tolumonas sp.]|uniref:lactonase family protein n=1 Tax=uncultured Tolumonas sp. TaxID=263765 RepID=UPI00293135C2|nr:lactonase family protein [uncultured Tolumonas sp.]
MNTNLDELNGEQIVAFVGTYGDKENHPGGIYTLHVENKGKNISVAHNIESPMLAGYLSFDKTTNTLYSVDERKNDGRGPVEPAASVMAFSVTPKTGKLAFINSHIAPGPRPTYLSLDSENRRLVTANHGDFDHVEKVVFKNGQWVSEYVYDDSTVILYSLNQDGSIAGISDLVVLTGHGKDPNNSKQAGGHAQSNAHAHSSVLSPDKKYLLVCDKGTDKILVFRITDKLNLVHEYQFSEEIAPRHLEFSTDGNKVFLTLELSSQVASMKFDQKSGALELIDIISSVKKDFKSLNEPAEIRLHPNNKFLYVNNRGEDSLAWFSIDADCKLKLIDNVSLAKSIHPGLAARSFAFSPSGDYLLLADRPANLVKCYSVDPETGALSFISSVDVPQPAFVEFASL